MSSLIFKQFIGDRNRGDLIGPPESKTISVA